MTFYKPPKGRSADLPKIKKNKFRRAKKINWKILSAFFVFLLLSGGFVYLLFWSPVFAVGQINTSGEKILTGGQIKTVVQEYLDNKILKIIPGDRLPIINDQKLAQRLKNELAETAEVKIRKIFPDKLKIVVVERKSVAIWCWLEDFSAAVASSSPAVEEAESAKKMVSFESDNCFFMDDGGIIYRPAPRLGGSLTPVFFGKEAPNLGSRVVSSSTISLAADLKRELKKAGVDLSEFLLDSPESREITALTNEGWLVYFDATRPADKQAKILELLLAGELKDRKNLKYVDLRIEGRAYYK